MAYPPIILASKSPRRRKLLRELRVPFKVVPSKYEEEPHDLLPREFVRKNAIHKAEEVFSRYPDAIVIGVDTVGAYKNHILEKPRNKKHAREILKLLSGTTHYVYSGVAVFASDRKKPLTKVVETKVRFVKFTEPDIRNYILSGEGNDKAASYAIQGLGSLFVKKIEGDYFNVVGLPVFALARMLKKVGVDIIDNYTKHSCRNR